MKEEFMNYYVQRLNTDVTELVAKVVRKMSPEDHHRLAAVINVAEEVWSDRWSAIRIGIRRNLWREGEAEEKIEEGTVYPACPTDGRKLEI